MGRRERNSTKSRTKGSERGVRVKAGVLGRGDVANREGMGLVMGRGMRKKKGAAGGKELQGRAQTGA